VRGPRNGLRGDRVRPSLRTPLGDVRAGPCGTDTDKARRAISGADKVKSAEDNAAPGSRAWLSGSAAAATGPEGPQSAAGAREHPPGPPALQWPEAGSRLRISATRGRVCLAQSRGELPLDSPEAGEEQEHRPSCRQDRPDSFFSARSSRRPAAGPGRRGASRAISASTRKGLRQPARQDVYGRTTVPGTGARAGVAACGGSSGQARKARTTAPNAQPGPGSRSVR